jgi:succinoglycan biosynthesis transport protein ExoP
MNGNDSGSRQISGRDILTVIFRRKVPVAVVAVIVAAATLTAASRTGSVYEAASKIFIRRSGPSPTTTTWTPYYGLEEEMNTEVEIAQSVDVMQRAVEVLNERGVYFQTQVGDSVMRRKPTIGDVAAGLSVTPIEMSNVLLVKYTGSNPSFVEAAANAVAEAYVEHRVEVRSSSGIEEYFRDQLSLLEAKLLDLITQQLHIRKESNIFDLEWQNQTAIARKSEIQEEMLKTRSQRLAEEEKLVLIRQRMEENPELGVPFSTFDSEKIGGNLLASYWTLRNQRDEKAAALTENNPEVRMLDKRIADMKQHIAEEVQRRIEEREFLVEDLKAEEAGYQASIDEISEEMRQVPDAVAQIEHLEKEINYTYDHYDKVLEKMLDSMASEADDIRLSNAKILSPASAHLTSVGRMQGVYVIFSILLGVVLGVGFGFLLENLDQSVRSATDVEDELGMTLLGSVPETRRLSGMTRRLDKTFGRKTQ